MTGQPHVPTARCTRSLCSRPIVGGVAYDLRLTFSSKISPSGRTVRTEHGVCPECRCSTMIDDGSLEREAHVLALESFPRKVQNP